MLSISEAKSASNGMEYFEVDSYYAMNEKYGQWYGNGAKELGLSGRINSDDFNKILNGFDKDSKPLVKNAGKEDIYDEKGKLIKKGHRSYVDYTFSCPKSVSILSYTDKRIEELHNAAVEKTLSIIENNYSITRIGSQGSSSIRTGNIIAARFNHYESRELDPQLHTHCVLMNLTQGSDKKWRSIEMGEIFKNKLYLGQIYRNELAKELTKIGYTIEVADRAKGTFDIKGVDKEIINEFSKRRKQILEAKKNYEHYSVSEAEKLAYACLDSRKYKNKTTVEELRKDVQESLKEYKTSLEQIKEESLRVTEPSTENNQITLHQCIQNALEDVTENKSAFRKEDVLTLALKNGLGQYTVEEIHTAFEDDKEIRRLGEKDLLIGKGMAPDVAYYTTDEMEHIERGILRTAEYGKRKGSVFVEQSAVENKLQQHTELTAGQQCAIALVCTSRDTLVLVQGDSGSGKTYAADMIRQIMEEQGYTVRGFSPTGKAALELRSAQIDTSTIDSFLQSSKKDIQEKELWIVDEAGMVGSRKLARFLKEAEQHDAKVVLIGDTKQFTSIDQGKIFADLQKYATVGYAEITEVRRQKTAHMKDIVHDFKKKDTGKALQKMQEHGLVHEIKKREKILDAVSTDYLSDRVQGKESIIVSTLNQDRNALNARIRSELVSMNMVEKGTDFTTFQPVNVSGSARRYADSYKQGQVIFFQKEVKEIGIQRGTQAEIVAVNSDENTLRLRFWDKKSSAYREHYLSMYDHAPKISAFNVNLRTFGVGDHVVFQKNDKMVGVQNGLLGVITSINTSGNATVAIPSEVKSADVSRRFGNTDFTYTVRFTEAVDEIARGTEGTIRGIDLKERCMTVAVKDREGVINEHTVDLTEHTKSLRFFENREVSFNIGNVGSRAYNYIDHGYAVTTYDAQGCSIDTVRWVPDVTQQTSYNEAYVAITRARHAAYIYTGDFEKLKEAAALEQQKDSVLEFRGWRPRIDDFNVAESMEIDYKSPSFDMRTIAIDQKAGELLAHISKEVEKKQPQPELAVPADAIEIEKQQMGKKIQSTPFNKNIEKEKDDFNLKM